jgi:hypothetical protein
MESKPIKVLGDFAKIIARFIAGQLQLLCFPPFRMKL